MTPADRTPARAVVEATEILDAFENETTCPHGEHTVMGYDCLIARIDAALRERERATWRAAGEMVKEYDEASVNGRLWCQRIAAALARQGEA